MERTPGQSSRLTFILGCTGCGKAAAGRLLAEQQGAEILSMDSMKIYRGMDIGTAKPTVAQRAACPHHLIDVAGPDEEFSVAMFLEHAERAVRAIAGRGRRILCVGGTALYIKALSEGLFEGPSADEALRDRLRAQAASEGSQALHDRLLVVDPVAAERIHPNDLRRLVRALEVYQLTGTPISALQTQWKDDQPACDCTFIGLRRVLEDQNRRTNLRVQRMMDLGLLEEVRGLLDEGPPLSPTARKAVGYAELIAHLGGEVSLNQAVENIKINTRQFAKAQRTWFKRFAGVHWLDLAPDSTAESVVEQIGALGSLMVVQLTEVTNWAVDLINVRKTYRGGIEALRGVNVQVGRGEIFGLLGPNGAGKTTLVKIMMTVVQPTSAVGTVLGRPLGHKRKRERIGYLPENHRFPRYLTGWQLLDSYAALARVPKKVRRQRAGELLERMGLDSWADIRIGRYSKGMVQRLGLAQALINDPDLIVLDEPTDGVDPMGRRDIRELLLEYRDRGKTIFINSHLLSELEMVCDRVSILVDGLVARQGRLRELTEHSIEYHILIEGELASLAAAVAELGGRIEHGRIVVAGHDARLLNRFIDMLRQKERLIEAVEPRRFSLEEIFVETLRGQKGMPTVGRDARKGGA